VNDVDPRPLDCFARLPPTLSAVSKYFSECNIDASGSGQLVLPVLERHDAVIDKARGAPPHYDVTLPRCRRRTGSERRLPPHRITASKPEPIATSGTSSSATSPCLFGGSRLRTFCVALQYNFGEVFPMKDSIRSHRRLMFVAQRLPEPGAQSKADDFWPRVGPALRTIKIGGLWYSSWSAVDKNGILGHTVWTVVV
jgi:hypothetical protein